jgi:tetratricopeptide (TPR) repeat protein
MTLQTQPISTDIATQNQTRARRGMGLVIGALDIALGISVVGLIVFATAAFGTVKPWSELIAIQVGAGIAAGLALRVLIAGGLPKTAAYVPIAAFLAIVLLQITTLPAWLVGAISPRTLADKTRLLSDLPGSVERLRHMTFSYYLPASYHDLRIILLDILVFLTILAIARSPRRILALLIGFSIVAAALAVEALLQDWKNAPNILWINGADTHAWAGPFVNHSDFSQQMNNLCGWVLALMLVAAGAAWPRNAWRRGLRIAGICLLSAVFIGGVIATLYCQSRGGVTCVIIGGAVVILGLVSRRGKRGLVWLIVVLGCAGLATALCVGFDSIYTHMLTIEHSNEYASRVSNVKDIIGISRHYPLLGTGLGTHEVFFPRYETAAGGGLSTHAEVEYAQALEETGYIGLACVLLFAGIIWVYWKRAVANAAEPITIAAIGLGFGLAAVEAQSFSDFGQHLPSLGCLTAVTCAMMINLGQLRSPVEAGGRRISMGEWASRLIGRAAFVGILLFASGWCVRGATRSALADALLERANNLESFMEDNPWDRTAGHNSEALTYVLMALDAEPLRIDANMWLGWYRWEALTTPLGTGSPVFDPAFVPQFVVDPNHPDPEWARRTVDALNEARWACPTYGPIDTLIGEIERDPHHDPIAEAHIRLGAELAPHVYNSLWDAASLDARQGLWEDAARLYRNLLAVNPAAGEGVISVYVNELHHPDKALEVEPTNWQFLQTVMNSTPDAAVKQQATARIRELLIVACAGPHPSGVELASLAQIRQADGDLHSAADLYRRAIQQDYGQVGWHLALARVLLQLNDSAGAQAEVNVCLHLQPDYPPAIQLQGILTTSAPQ